MIILGIESSCDETAAAVVRDGYEVLADIISSQVDMHADFGGIVPEMAAREHLRNINPIIDNALRKSKVEAGDLDGIAVTCMPGLVTSLLIGLNYAKGMALASGIPLVGINHFLAHIYSCFLASPEIPESTKNFPLLGLVVSGGHTNLVLIEADGHVQTIGQTIDDAAGEAFDKGARILKLGYPGGPAIENQAADGNPGKHRFPRGLTGGGGKPVSQTDRFNFSFSGLKTSLLYKVKNKDGINDRDLNDLAASYQAAIIDVLVKKTMNAADYYAAPTILLCGGVACNRFLRQQMKQACDKGGKKLIPALPRHCTDNAAMVAGLAWHELRKGRVSELDLDAQARLPETLPPASFAPECV